MKMTITEKADAVKPIKPQLDDVQPSEIEFLETLYFVRDMLTKATDMTLGIKPSERKGMIDDALNEARAAIQKARGGQL